MNYKKLLSSTLTACLILTIVPGLCVISFAATESETNQEAEQHFQKANDLHIQADYEAAIAEYQKVISLSPNSKIAQNAKYWIGQLYFESKRFDAALSAFQKLLNEYPESKSIPATKQMIESVQQAKKNKALWEAVKKADVEQVRSLIAEGVDVDVIWPDVYRQNEVSWPRDTERTPLRHAVKVGNIEVVKLLVEADADVNSGKWPPLCDAVAENNKVIAEYLIDHGANVNPTQYWGPLQAAPYTSNNIEMVKLLIARGADINMAGPRTALQTSINRGRKDIFGLLIQLGADVNAKDHGGFTPLYYAIHNDDLDYMNTLIANGANVSTTYPGGETLLGAASVTGRTDVVKLLLEAGADVNAKNDGGVTALHRAARLGKMNVAKLLITRGADINTEDKQGHTPLYVAVNHDYQVAELLLSKGADGSIRTESGKTLLELAEQRKRLESTAPDLIFDGDPNIKFGRKIACGDVDGDGYDDILIVATSYKNKLGGVYLFYGGPDMDTTADLILEGQNKGDFFGNGIVCGDIDNDGYEDIVIAASYFNEKRGCAYLYWGSDRNSMDAKPDKIFDGEAEKGAEFGACYPAVYDIDNDGYDDIVLGACHSSDKTGRAGRAYLYFGNTKESMDTSYDRMFKPKNPEYCFGYTIGCGDVDNDGYGDIVIGGWDRPSRTYLYYGGSKSNMDAKADVVFKAQSEGNNNFGCGIVCVDQNSDGYDDIVIGAPSYNNRQGRSYLFHGNSRRSMDAEPDMIFDGEVEGSNYGFREVRGDIDGDKVNDIIIGAYNYEQLTGRLYVYWGNEMAGSDPKPGRILTGDNPGDHFGFGLACGDVNNDGYEDLVIGAYGYKAGAKQGRAYLYYGGPKNK